MRPYALGLIGYGKIAADQHLPAIAKSDCFRLAVVASRHADRIEGVDRVAADPRELLDDPKIDAVVISSAVKDHYGTARAAILAGKPVMLEKPPAVTLGQAEALRDLARSRDVPVFTTWHARENAAVDEARARLEGQEVARLKITWKEDVRRWHPGQAWVWQAGGFGVFDPGINAFSIVTAILPAPIFVTCAQFSRPANQQTPIAATVAFGSEPTGGDLSADLDWRQTGEQIWTVEVETGAGSILRLLDGGAKLELDGKLAVEAEPAEYPRLYARFADLLETRRSDVDLRPLRLVADAFLCADASAVEPFDP